MILVENEFVETFVTDKDVETVGLPLRELHGLDKAMQP